MEENKYQPPVKMALLLLLIGVAVGIHQFKVPPIMVQIADSMGAGKDQAPALMSVFMLTCLIFSIPAGSIVEKVKTKWVLLMSAAIIGVGATIGALTSSYNVLLFSRAVEGFGFLLMSIGIPVAVTRYSDPKKVGFVMGIAGVWISVGSIVAFNTVPWLSQLTSWQGTWWIYIVFTLLVMGIFSYGFKGGKTAIDEKSKRDSESIITAFKNKDLLFGAFGFLVFNLNLLAMITFFPIHATDTGLFTLSKASFIASLPMILSLVTSPVFGKLADKLGHKWLYAIAVLASGVGASLMFAKSMAVVMVGTFLLGLVGVASPPLIFSSISKMVPKQSLLAKSNSVVVLFQNSGMFLASFVFGKIALGFGGNYSLAGLFLLPLSVLSALLILFIDYNKGQA